MRCLGYYCGGTMQEFVGIDYRYYCSECMEEVAVQSSPISGSSDE